MDSEAIVGHILQALFLLLAIALLFALPALDRKTRLFGVEVEPAERKGEAARAALRVYRLRVLGFALAGIAVAGIGAGIGEEAAFAITWPIAWTLVLVGTLAGYVAAHRRALGIVRGTEREAAAIETERRWKAGVVYYNPDDPALLVEKRFGWGWTLNFARPAAWLLVGLPLGLALLVIAVVVLTA